MNQHVANLTAASTLTAIDLGAELQAASPEVRAAAVLRSQRLPKPEVVRDAWRSLPGSLQDQIGTAALTHSFYSRESQEDPCGLTLEAGRWAEKIETQALNEVETIAIAALPELYGTDDAAPAWTLSDTPLSFPDPLAFVPTKLPPKVRAEAVARARRIPGLDDILAAWTRLPPDAQDRLGVQAVAFAFYGWLSEDADHEPADRWLTDKAVSRCVRKEDQALNLLGDIARRSLPELFGTRRRDPAWARGAVDAEAALGTLWEAALPSPILFAIALHRRTWQALQASNAARQAAGWTDREGCMWPAAEAEDEAFTDITMLSCRSRADATALLKHLRWYLGTRPQHPKHPEMSEGDASIVAVRMADLALMLGEDGASRLAPPAGGLLPLLQAHRAAWDAYAAAQAPEMIGWEAHQKLDDTAGSAAGAVLAAPVSDHAEAAALVDHAAWYWAALETVGQRRADGFEYDAKQLRARAGDWAMFLGR